MQRNLRKKILPWSMDFQSNAPRGVNVKLLQKRAKFKKFGSEEQRVTLRGAPNRTLCRPQNDTACLEPHSSSPMYSIPTWIGPE